MKVKCKNCLPKEGIEIPQLSNTEKQLLWELKMKSSLYAVKEMITKGMFSHIDAKYVMTHINLEYGKCNRCSIDNLDHEYITCPKCGALNFNWSIDYKVITNVQ